MSTESAITLASLFDHYAYFKRIGFIHSFEVGAPVDTENRPIPWYTYSAIDFLKDRVTHEHLIFEYGCGNSTLWYAERAKFVMSVDNDLAWARKISKQQPKNACIVHVPLDETDAYECSILKYSETHKFDIVVIDGRRRNACALHSVAALNAGGVIVFDNVDRPDYDPARAFLRKQGFREIVFKGLCPCVVEEIHTSILYRDGNCFGI